MKPKNFPGRKLIRKMRTENIDVNSEESKRLLDEARSIKTKKVRGKK